MDEHPPEPHGVEDCPQCGGLGEVPDDGTNQGECDYCGGSGIVEIDDDRIYMMD